jgi:hypothetical protein
MATALIGTAVLVLALALVVLVARDPGPAPADVALGYEQAWDGMDFTALWDLSGDELRDGLGRVQFVAAKSAAYAEQAGLGHLARSVVVEDSHADRSLAVVHTRIDLRDGGAVRNTVQLSKRGGRWVVVGYRLRSPDERAISRPLTSPPSDRS